MDLTSSAADARQTETSGSMVAAWQVERGVAAWFWAGALIACFALLFLFAVPARTSPASLLAGVFS